MNIYLKSLAILLSASFLLAAGCSDSSAVDTAVPVTETEKDIAETEDIRISAKDNLPEDLNYDGKTVCVLSRGGDNDTLMEFTADALNGEIVNDAVYARNLAVCERLNIGLEIRYSSDSRHSGAETNSLINKSVSAGSDEFDLIGNHMSQVTPLAAGGVFYNWSSVKYIDYDMPWWNDSYIKTAAVSGNLYTIAGELGETMISGMYVMFFNKDIASNFFPDLNLYDTVNLGQWTLDKMKSLSTELYTDLNGNAVADLSDLYGFTFRANGTIQSDALAGACDVVFTELGDDGYYEYILNSEHTMNFISKVASLLFDSNYTYLHDVSDDPETMDKIKNGTTLFLPWILGDGISQLRDMERDYGIIPLPKYDENQETCHGFTHNGFSVFAIPITCPDTEIIGAFSEAMCSETYRSVTHAYYDIALKVKYSRDEEASGMLDLITEGIRFDFAYINNQSLNSAASIFRDIFKTSADAGKAASTIASITNTVNKAIIKLTDKYNAGN